MTDSLSAEDLSDLRTHLLKRHAEEIRREIAAIDPAFTSCSIVVLAQSNEVREQEEDVYHRMALVTNVTPEMMVMMFAHACNPAVIQSRKPFRKGH